MVKWIIEGPKKKISRLEDPGYLFSKNCTFEPNTMKEAIVQALPVQSNTKQGNQSSRTPSAHCTRSQAAPDWSTQEVLVLLNEVAAIDEDWLEELSSYQRWKIVSDSCMAMNVARSSTQCKKKWEMLLGDYKKIKFWESRSMNNSYWYILEDKRKDFGLPTLFPKEIFDAMDAVIQVQKHQSDSTSSDPDLETSYVDADSEEEYIPTSKSLKMEEMTTSMSPDMQGLIVTTKSQEVEDITIPRFLEVEASYIPEKACARTGKEKLMANSKSTEIEELITPKCQVEDFFRTSERTEMQSLIAVPKIPHETTAMEVLREEEFIQVSKDSEKSRVMAAKLQVCAKHVCAVLQGELQDGASHCPPASLDPSKPTATQTEFARRQADELIKALTGLTDSLGELCDLVRSGR